MVAPEKAIVSLLEDCRYSSVMYSTMVEMSVKWTLNAISTGAHVMCGKVFTNRMIDVQVRYVRRAAVLSLRSNWFT